MTIIGRDVADTWPRSEVGRHPSCRFCTIASGRSPKEPDRILLETKSHVVIASIGALVPGWTMIVPRRHECNLSATLPDPQFLDLCQQVAERLATAFPATEVRIFEHGSQGQGSLVGCGVDHAHMHLVPLRDTLEPWIRRQSPSLDWHRVRLAQVAERAGDREYLLYSDDVAAPDPRCLLSLPSQPTSQFFRRALASAQGRPKQFDYRVHAFLPNVSVTQATLTSWASTLQNQQGASEATEALVSSTDRR